MGAIGAVIVWGLLVRLSLDSARTKNTTANIVASQKISRTAFNLFIVLLLFSASATGFSLRTDRTSAGALRSTPAILRRKFQTRQAQSFVREPSKLLAFTKER